MTSLFELSFLIQLLTVVLAVYTSSSLIPNFLYLLANAKPVPVPNRLQQSLESSRQDEIRKKQSTPSEEYNPWGRPGAGAPMKTGTGNIRSALKRYVSSRYFYRL